jgi:hypothetical protein
MRRDPTYERLPVALNEGTSTTTGASSWPDWLYWQRWARVGFNTTVFALILYVVAPQVRLGTILFVGQK